MLPGEISRFPLGAGGTRRNLKYCHCPRWWTGRAESLAAQLRLTPQRRIASGGHLQQDLQHRQKYVCEAVCFLVLLALHLRLFLPQTFLSFQRKVQISTSITPLRFFLTSSSCQHRPPRSLLKTVGGNRKCMNTPT